LMVAGVIGIAFALAFNLYIQGSMSRLTDPAWILENYAGPGSLLNYVGLTWPPSALAWKSLEAASSGTWMQGLGWASALLALGLGAAIFVVLALAGVYVRSLLDFGEGIFKRLSGSETADFIGSGFRRQGLFRALVIRENRLMNREPMYFLNGPFIIVLMPIILAVMYFVQREALSQLAPLMEAARRGPYGLLVGAGFGGFLGSSTSIACTALSRDAKALPYLRALPIGARQYMLGKLAHGLVYAALGSLVGGLGMGLILGLGPAPILASIFIALGFSSLANMAGLWIDTANPRLAWDNPVAALKQNPNSSLAILGSMAILAALGALASVLPLGALGFTLVYGGGTSLLFAILLFLYPKFAETKLEGLEA
ncbi:MAG: hypothetical protein WCL50_06955, partial [Spirochaetota bacterium]